MTAGHSFGDLGLDRDAIIEEIVAGPPTIGSAAGIIFRAYARRFGKPRWGDKRPAYILYLDVLLWMFPDAQIIHIVRDGRDCTASMKEADWFRGHIDKGIFQWVRSMSAAERAARALRPDQFHELCYEDLVTDPEAELRKICDFLEEEYDPARDCQANGGTRLVVGQRRAVESRPSKVMSKALSASFHRWVQRARPLPLGSRAITAR